MEYSPVNKAFIYNLQGLARTAFSRIRSAAVAGNTASGRPMADTVMIFNIRDGLTIYGLDSKVTKIANQNIGSLLNILA